MFVPLANHRSLRAYLEAGLVTRPQVVLHHAVVGDYHATQFARVPQNRLVGIGAGIRDENFPARGERL